MASVLCTQEEHPTEMPINIIFVITKYTEKMGPLDALEWKLDGPVGGALRQAIIPHCD